MNAALSRLLVLFVCICGALFPAEPRPNVPPAEIGRLILATALLEYPIEQNKLHEALGLSSNLRSSGGSWDYKKQASCLIWPLAETAEGGTYVMHTFLSNDTMETTGRYPLITGAVVVYSVSGVGTFMPDPGEHPLNRVERLRPMLRASGLSVGEFTAPAVFRKYLRAVVDAETAEWHAQMEARKLAKPASGKP
jgi:hypothetical protein